MKKTILTTIASLMLVGLGQARTWTSADGSKTFEGDFVSCDDTSVTVKRGLKEMTFKLTLLSDEDQKWAKEEAAKMAAAEEGKAEAAEFMESDFGKALKKLQKFNGRRFVDHELESPPKYFLLYFSASWCGPCRNGAPQLAETYKQEIAPNPNLEMVHISRDQNEDDALSWAKSFEQPWPIMLMKDTKDKLIAPYNVRAIPTYILVDREGKEITRGKAAALAAAKKDEA